MDTPPSDSGRKLWLLPFLLTGVATSLLGVFWFALQPNINNGQRAAPIAVEVKNFSREDTQKLIELRNQAIGNLENHEFAKADLAFSEIQRLLPTEPFATRNLAICRQLALEATDAHRSPEQYRESATEAEASSKSSKDTEPKSFIPWVIAARVASKAEQPELALTNLREAVRLAPDSVGPAYDLFSLLQATPGDKLSDEGFNALRSVSQKEPQNLFVLKDWLLLLAQRQAPEFVDSLKQAEITIAPFVEMIKVHTRIDLRKTVEDARVAANEGKWANVQRLMMVFRNLIVSESARDKRFVILDSLEYLLHDYSQETLSRFDLSTTDSSLTKPVHFQRPDDVSKWPLAIDCVDFAVTDFDLDQRFDLIVLEKEQLAAWKRNANDEPWEIIAKSETGGTYAGLLAFDFDDDVQRENTRVPSTDNAANPIEIKVAPEAQHHTADPDAILFGADGLKLFENSKNVDSKTRTLILKSGGAEFDGVRDVVTAAVADLDSDGDLDLVVSTTVGLRIFSNRGNLTFEETTDRSQLPSPDTHVTAFAIVDWDKDSDIDLIVATSNGAGVLENVRHGQVRYRALNDFHLLQQATNLCIGDFDGNASWDVVAAGPKGAHVVLTNRTPAGIVTVRKMLSFGFGQTPVHSIQTGDFDNDGILDFILLKEDGAKMFCFDERQAVFAFVPRDTYDQTKGISRFSVEDLDRDGDLDLIVAEAGNIICLSNQCRESDNLINEWLEIELVAEPVRQGEQNWEKRTNHINLGGMLEVKAGGRYQARVVTSPITHFGLGPNRNADLARILWTNGIPSNVMNPSLNQSISIEQKLGGSCPYLYTWNGERFVFVTDLLWNAPLGLKFAETVIAPWREWEYLKIDGDQLVAANNEYQLRITAELWEAEYFDQIKLYAIDHPAGTDIFTNEKVGPASIAEPKIHTVQSPRKPIAARDTQGRDILAQVIARDENYTKTFDKRLAQGFTEEHFLELDLGEFTEANNITLFLTGWMYPGSTSLSVQFSQNPDLPKPRPPALYTPDSHGDWREVRPFMGFPGGKTKTIAIDLSDVFVNNDHRLRIVSTMEIFWDRAFFTVDDAPIDFQQTELTLVRAGLRDRGGVSSRSWPVSGNGPDHFDYTTLVPGEQWPAMSGHFTRFGDVSPLLITRDDQLVVIGSGDEIQLAFAEPDDPLPSGWVRDFVIYSVGWDKDADQNTVYGNTVEPLPFEAMTVYAHRDGEPRPLDPAYVKYLREYQTRTRNPSKFWKSVHQFSGSRQ